MNGRPPVLPILWGAMLASQGIFQGVLLFVERPTELETPMLLGVMLGVAAVEAALGLIGVPMLFKHLNAQSAFILRMAFFEAVVIDGFVLAFLGAHIGVSLGLFAVSVALNVVTFPTVERYTAWEVERLGDGRGPPG